MKIALVSPYDYAYPGGVTVHISHLERQFIKMGHSVRILAPCSKRAPWLSENVIPLGTPVPIPTSGSIARITLSLNLSSRVKAILERENLDVIHLHEPLTPMLPPTVLRMSNVVNVGTFHAYHGKPRGYWLGKPLLRRWFNKLDGRIAVSKPAMEFASRHFPGPYTIIPNGVDLENFHSDVPPIDDFCDGKLNILFVGRLEKRKGLVYLLRAYKLIKREFPNSRLIIVGPGTRLRKGYEKLVRENNLREVVFAGYVSDADLPSYYNAADVFCAPATGQESFGMVLLEAMATSKPIIASNIQGYASVVNHGVEGLLIPPKDKEALAQALASLLNDKPLRQQMGARGNLKAKEYSWERIAQKILDYYVSLLSEPSARK